MGMPGPGSDDPQHFLPEPGNVAAEARVQDMSTGVWQEKREIESFDADAKGRLRPSVLFSFMLNSAWKHASSLGFGYQDFATRKIMWVLSEFQLRIWRIPCWTDAVTIETWGKKITRFYALRDFAVCRQSGEKLASATGAWIVLDRESYRPQRLEQLMADFPWQIDKSELETGLKRIPESTGAQERKHYAVQYSDLDANDHVNAARYLQWIMDSYPRDVQEQRQLSAVEMSFLAEATVDDEIAVLFKEEDGRDVAAVRRLKDNKDVCRAVVRWQG